MESYWQPASHASYCILAFEKMAFVKLCEGDAKGRRCTSNSGSSLVMHVFHDQGNITCRYIFEVGCKNRLERMQLSYHTRLEDMYSLTCISSIGVALR